METATEEETGNGNSTKLGRGMEVGERIDDGLRLKKRFGRDESS